jgi:hypothetical protein
VGRIRVNHAKKLEIKGNGFANRSFWLNLVSGTARATLFLGVIMKAILSAFTGLVITGTVIASVCNQKYHLQSAAQVMLEGDSPSTLKQKGESLKLNKSMNNATILHDSTEYKLMTDFDATGTCDEWTKRSVDYAIRKKGERNFANTSMDYFLKLNIDPFTLKKPGWDGYWFGIASSIENGTVSLFDAVGKNKIETQMYLWYGNATLKRTFRSKEGAPLGFTSHFYPYLTSHPDSAALIQVLLDTWKTYVKSDTLEVLFSVQLIKVVYDSLPSPLVKLKSPKLKSVSGFQTSQVGQMVLIHSGQNKTFSEPLSLFGMMGNKVATLHPTGYVFQWNGKTSNGEQAQTGVYFIQSGNKILGKFFYTR